MDWWRVAKRFTDLQDPGPGCLDWLKRDDRVETVRKGLGARRAEHWRRRVYGSCGSPKLRASSEGAYLLLVYIFPPFVYVIQSLQLSNATLTNLQD